MTKLLLILLLACTACGHVAAQGGAMNIYVAALFVEDEKAAQDTGLYSAEEQLYASACFFNAAINPIILQGSCAKPQLLHPGYAEKPYIPPGIIWFSAFCYGWIH